MVTKEQALNCKQFKQIYRYPKSFKEGLLSLSSRIPNYKKELETAILLDKPANWRANGKCQTWKTRPDEFKLPIKHGLYDYGYITHENAHLFEVA